MYRIGISGKANSGKNTLASLLEQELYDKHIRAMSHFHSKFMAFADPIKEIVMTMFPQADKECLYGASHLRDNIIPNAFKDGEPLSYRQALLDIGTQGRTYDKYIWVNIFNHRFKIISSNIDYEPNLVIVPDTRFREEFNYLKQEKFFQIRLYRDDIKTKPIDHDSETNQSSILDQEFDYVLYNNCPLDKLKEEIETIIVPSILLHSEYYPRHK